MIILFLCGSLEPGKDGVGDYTRRLAGQLRKNGQTTFLLSINDLHVTIPTEELQNADIEPIPTLRLSASQSWKTRMNLAKTWIEDKNPDWLSLQYVLYSFHPKGLPFKLSGFLKSIGQGYKWHIMFHELWLGIKRDAPYKHYVYGFFQTRLIRSMIKTLAPAYITTSNRIYQLELEKIGTQGELLPLFSNIPLQTIDETFIHSVYQKAGVKPAEVAQYRFIGIFGSLPEDKDMNVVLNEQISIAKTAGKKLVFIGFGRSASAARLEKLSRTFANAVVFVSLGELSGSQVSSVLQLLHVGISSTPKEYVGKSGVYAAMRLHNLPVLLYSGMEIPQYKREIEVFNSYLENREPATWDVKHIATIFYENIRLHTDL